MQRRQLLLSAVLLVLAAPALAQLRWQQGTHYQLLPTEQRAGGAPADRIEVAEVFSYGCPHCDEAKENMALLAASLPADAAMVYVHAAFRSDDAWPMFQRAFYAAQELGIAASTHEAMFDAIWKTGEIPLIDMKTHTLKRPSPTIRDAARFYAKHSKVTQEAFLATANSEKVSAQMRRADALVKQWRVPGTPQLVVNGRYLVSNDLPFSQQTQVVHFLISQERARTRQK